MRIETIQTGSTLVSSAVPDRSTHRWGKAYSRLFQNKKSRICVPVKCFYVEVNSHHILIDAGWSLKVVTDPKKHLGFGLYYASEPVMKSDEAAVKQLVGKKIDAIYMTHLDCDHISGLHDFSGIPIFASADEIEEANRNKLRYGKLIRDIKVNTMCFDNDGNAPFGKSKDLFGDGSVIAYLTPTHSKGSVVYKICDENTFALIVGDNGYKKDSWEKGILPGPLYNSVNMKKSLAWIKDKSQDNKCVGVYCAHELVFP